MYPPAASLDGLFWTWTHYAAAKLRRGELFEALSRLNLIRTRLLFSLIATMRKTPFHSLTRFEAIFHKDVKTFCRTLAGYEAPSCAAGLRAAIDLYLDNHELIRGTPMPSGVQHAVINAIDECDGLIRLNRSGRETSRLHSIGIPQHIRNFFDVAVPRSQMIPEVLGIAIIGSWLGANEENGTQQMDASSDLDVYVVGTETLADDHARQDELARALFSLYLSHRPNPKIHPNWIVCVKGGLKVDHCGGVKIDQ